MQQPTSAGADMILAERIRQLASERFDGIHDSRHTNGQLVKAAISYAASAGKDGFAKRLPERALEIVEHVHRKSGHQFIDPWPWEPHWDKRSKHDRLRKLVIAGALIAAEIDRLLAKNK